MNESAGSAPEMRLIVASIQDYDAGALLRDLTERGWRATQIASTGSLFRSGATTLLIGVPARQARQVLRLIDEHCGRTAAPPPVELGADEESWAAPGALTELGGAAVSVLRVVRFERL